MYKRQLEDRASRAAVDAERAVLATLEGGCSAPIGALAEVVEGEDGDELWVRAIALSRDGALSVRMSATGDPGDATGVGTRLAKEMFADGAADLETAGPEPTAGPAPPAGQAVPAGPDGQPDVDKVHDA